MNKEIKVAAIQLNNDNKSITERLNDAETLIMKAIYEGAKLVVLPELSSCSYIPNDKVWDYGELKDGQTSKWARQLATKYQIYLGAGFLECENEDFYNSYLLASPDGQIGIIHKNNSEIYCYKSDFNGVYVDTDLGRIGIGICADNHFIDFYKKILDANVDLILMPHAWATPCKISKAVNDEDIKKTNSYVEELSKTYAFNLNIPTIFVNPVGDVLPMKGILGKLMSSETFKLQGGSQIVDSNGEILGKLINEQGILIRTITLNNDKHRNDLPKSYDGWVHPGSKLVRRIIIPLDKFIGTKYYKFNKNRLKTARKINAIRS